MWPRQRCGISKRVAWEAFSDDFVKEHPYAHDEI